MTGQLTCDGCGKRYWPQQWWIHEGCATNTTATNARATNADGLADEVNEPSSDRTPNRRLRKDYNEYQRKLMKKRRAKGVKNA